MNKTRWVKSIDGMGVSRYWAKIGIVELLCRPKIKYLYNYHYRRRIVGWDCDVYFNNKLIATTRTVKVYNHDKPSISLKLCQENAEKLAVRYLIGYGLIAL